MHIALGSDHAGWQLRQHLMTFVSQLGHDVIDCGCATQTRTDYPKYAKDVGERVQQQQADYGILICGSGLGMSMAANRLHQIRAALCTEPYMAQLARAHNDANILCLGARLTGVDLAQAIVQAFLDAPFAGGRHRARIEQIHQLQSRP